MEALVICVGNRSQGDDGVAHRVAALLPPRPGVRVVSVGALDITNAEDVARSGLVVFVDARRRTAPPVEVERAFGEPLSVHDAHALAPAGVLSLAASLFGAAPVAYLVSVAAPKMGHATSLSPIAAGAAETAVEAVERLLDSHSPR